MTNSKTNPSDSSEPLAGALGLSDCAYCGKPMQSGKRGKKYCSNPCRMKAWKHKCDVCAYCGVPATYSDNIPHESVRKFLRESGRHYAESTVRCCAECKSALGASGFTYEYRLRIARDAMRAKYKQVLDHPRTDAQWAQNDRLLAQWVRARLIWECQPDDMSGDDMYGNPKLSELTEMG